ALVVRIEVPVAGPIGISTAEPLGVGALDREAAGPLAAAVGDGQRVGHVVTTGAELRSRQEDIVIAAMPARVDGLVGRGRSKDAFEVGVPTAAFGGGERPESIGEPDGVRRQPEAAGADAVTEVRSVGIGHVEYVLTLGHELVA